MPRSLFGRTALGLLLAFLLFETLAFGAVWQWVVRPLAERSADDLAARIVLAAKTWVELPPATRTDFEMELSFRHGLELAQVKERLPHRADRGLFVSLLENALSRRTQQHIVLKQGAEVTWYWLEIQSADVLLRVGFERERDTWDAPLVAVGIFLLGAILTVMAALLMAGRVSRRLRKLAALAAEVGKGRSPLPIPDRGAQEWLDLTAAFNRMVEEVRALLENRTVLLAGISHDLRTPITRLHLALSMLDEVDPILLARMEHDLEEMNRLIGDMLDFSRALQRDEQALFDLAHTLSELAEKAESLAQVRWAAPATPCEVKGSESAVRRIVANLLENACRYGGEAGVDVSLQCAAGSVVIEVGDHGPGIPADQREAVFRPFYRLEQARSREGGGSGLGLAIARQLADAHGWQIELAERDGGGLMARVIISRGT